MPFCGGLTSRLGCRTIITIASIVFCACLPFLVLAPNIFVLGITLLLFGASGGSLDVAMNIQAVAVEQASDRPMMSGFHGMFSVGGILGAGGLSLMMSAGLSPTTSQVIVTLICISLVVAMFPNLLHKIAAQNQDHHQPFAFPKGQVILLGVLCFIVFMGEGSVSDWSGILLKSFRHVDASKAGLGYVAFAAMMTLNRLTGDIVVAKLGRPMIVLGGCLCASTGFLLAAWVPFWVVALVGFAMVGIGLANVVPILFTASGRQNDMPPPMALSSITTMGYAGLLAGPPLLGFIASRTSLLVSLTILAFLCLFVALNYRRMGVEPPLL